MWEVAWKKWASNRKNRMLSLLLVVLVLMVNVYSYFQYDGHTLSYIDGVDVFSSFIHSELYDEQYELEQVPDKSEANTEYRRRYELHQLKYDVYRAMSPIKVYFSYGKDFGEATTDLDEERLVDALYSLSVRMLKAYEEGAIDDTHLNSYGKSIREIEEDILVSDWLREKNLQLDTNPYEPTAWKMTKLLVSAPASMVLVFLLVAFAIDAYTKEVNQGSYKIWFLADKGRGSLIIGQVLRSFLFVLFGFILLMIIQFLITGLVFEFGQADYPVLRNQTIQPSLFLGDYQAGIVPIWMYCATQMALIVLVAFSLSLFGVWMSVIFQSTVPAIIVEVLVLGGTYIHMSLFNKPIYFNPVQALYLNEAWRTDTVYSPYWFILTNVLLALISIIGINLVVNRVDIKD